MKHRGENLEDARAILLRRDIDASRPYVSVSEWGTSNEPVRVMTAPRSTTEQQLVDLFAEQLDAELDVLAPLPPAVLQALEAEGAEVLRETFEWSPSARLPNQLTLAGLAALIEADALFRNRVSCPLPAPGEATGKMSPFQLRLWFFNHLEGPSATFNLTSRLYFQGPLDCELLVACFQATIAQRVTTRSIFPERSGQPECQVQPVGPIPFALVDLAGQTRANELAETLLFQQATLPFVLASGPLSRILLIRLNPSEHLLCLSQHRIVSDRMSATLLFAELASRYNTQLRGEAWTQPQGRYHYTDFAAWQWLQIAQTGQAQEQFWKAYLADCPERHQFPMDRPRPSCQRFKGKREQITIFPKTLEGLCRLADAEGTSLKLVLQAAFTAFLSRYSQAEDLMLGTVFSYRKEIPEFHHVLGPFNNFLVLRTLIQDNPSFSNFLHLTRRDYDQVLAHRDLPFERVVELVQPQRDLGQAPLFQLFFHLRNPHQQPRFEGLETNLQTDHEEVSLFDLSLVLEPMIDAESGQAQVSGFFEYNADLFEVETVARIVRHFKVLLRSLVQAPHTRLSYLPLLSQEEQETILADWNTTAINFGARACIQDLFHRQAQLTPQAPALLFLGFDHVTYTYEELNHWANQVAAQLLEAGVGPENTVGLCTKRSPAQVAGLLGILKAGAAYMPLAHDFPADRLRFMVEDAAIEVLLADEKNQGLFHDFAGQQIVIPGAPSQDPRFWDNPVGNVRDYNRSCVIYTSGSEGFPRGVVLSHRALVNRFRWAQEVYPLHAEDRFLQLASIHFDVSLWEIMAPLISGAQLVLPLADVHKDLRELIALVGDHQVTVIHFIPNLLHNFLHALGRGSLPKLRLVFCGGETLALTTITQFYEKVSARLIHFYGPTEAAINVTAAYCRPDWHKVSIGRPIANTSTYVLDRYLHPLPPGVLGELYIGGMNLAYGYENRPGQTASSFIPNPYSGEHPFAGAGARLYRTGDLARLGARGKIYFQGRRDRQIKLNGFRVEPAEVERCLLLLDEVVDCAIECDFAEGSSRMIAYVAVAGETSTEPARFRHFLAQHLPSYMIPSVFVVVPSLPRLASGKLDHTALSLPHHLSLAASEVYVPPRTREEHVLSLIWAQILGREQVGVTDNFFRLGGDSMLVVRLEALAAAAGLFISTQQLFQAPTIAEVLGVLSQESERALVNSPLPCDLFEARAKERPNAPALLLDGDPLWLNYGQLQQAVGMMAGRLRQLGIGPGKVVGVCCGPKTAVVAFLAILKAGATVLPLDPESEFEARQYLADSCDMAAALVDDSDALAFSHVPLLLVHLDGRKPEPCVWPEMTGAHVACLWPCGKHDGFPEIAAITHEILLRVLMSLKTAPGLSSDDCLFSLRNTDPLWAFWPLCFGARLVLARASEMRDPIQLSRVLQKHTPTLAVVEPSDVPIFLEGSQGGENLKLLIDGDLPSNEGRVLVKRYRQVWRMFGQTEMGLGCAYELLNPSHLAQDPNFVGISAAFQGGWLYLLDGKLQPVRPGHEGELYIGGKSLPAWFQGSTVANMAKFVPDPFANESGQRLYRTNRRAFFQPDGHIVFSKD